MRTSKWIYAILIASVSWMACDDDDDAMDEPALSASDDTFVEFAARSNHGEIALSEIAVTKAADSLVRVFAQDMIDAHTTAQNELKDIADDHRGIDWPDGLTQEQDSLAERLENTSGESFDSLYIRTQIAAHEHAVTRFEDGAANAENARVKAYAGTYLPKIEMHLEKADSLYDAIVARNTTVVTVHADDDDMEEGVD